MAGKTPAQKASIEKKALASENKSDGMRQMFDAGYSAKEIAALFGAPYGFVYGVGIRHGAITPTPRSEKAPKAEKAAKAPAAKSSATAKAAVAAAKAPRVARATKAAAAPVAAKRGRPVKA